ncbi:MAG: 50S ribosomal protein L11 methyltransferase [Alteraurantiacibacter sp.]|nr:50S ribosomal protein L11 methyltransferase [Alteraurantiacibacter sp.]
MSGIWRISVLADREVIQAALAAQEECPEWDPMIGLSGSEYASGKAGTWQLEAWLEREPAKADLAAIAGLFRGAAPPLTVEHLPETDWVAQSQQGLDPIRAGRFHVRTPDHPPCTAPGMIDLVIPAGQAFGTGQHETTSGCLAMLDEMRKRGVVLRNCADIGTGTGILAFAALSLWPRARVIASDIDPVCIGIVADNAALNAVPLGAGPGQLLLTVGDGMSSPLIKALEPYDLVMANILAGPLIEMAPAFAQSLLPGGNLLLAGLLTAQEQSVRNACMRAGFRLSTRLVRGDWSILWLRRRAAR